MKLHPWSAGQLADSVEMANKDDSQATNQKIGIIPKEHTASWAAADRQVHLDPESESRYRN
jgi:hypothetical protein